MTKELYDKLFEKIDNIGFGITKTPESDEPTYLELIFGDEDAAYFIEMIEELETVGQIAARVGREPREAAEQLYGMSRRGLAYREKIDGVLHYRPVPLLHGIVEFNVNRHTTEQLKAFGKIAAAGLRPRYYAYEPFQRSMPINADVVKDGKILPEDDVRKYLKNARAIALANCICRTIKKQTGGDCKHTMQTCMAINGWADYYVENEDGKYISYEEALEILKLCDAEGLSVHCANSEETEIICCCCSCCCGLIRAYTFFPEGVKVDQVTNYYMTLDEEKCINCGLCAERCVMDALKMENGKLRHDVSRCNGCGLCASTCPTNAAMLDLKEEIYLPPGKSWFDTYKVMADDRRKMGHLAAK